MFLCDKEYASNSLLYPYIQMIKICNNISVKFTGQRKGKEVDSLPF